MNKGYQADDTAIIDYQLWRPPGLDSDLRGPPVPLEPGGYIVALGAAQTFGRFVEDPYPQRLSRQLGLPVLNLGISGAGPSFFLQRPEMLALVNGARLAIVQVMSGRSTSNSRFVVQRNQGLVRPAQGGADAPPRFAEHAYDAFLRSVPPEDAVALRAEIRARYLGEMRALLGAIRVPKLLFWFSTRTPAWREGLGNLEAFWGGFPHFINQDVLLALSGDAQATVECVNADGLPQPLVDRETGAPVEMWPADRFPHVRHRHHNMYYPSPGMHEAAEAALRPALESLLRPAARRPDAGRPRAVRPPRNLLVHMHIYKNAGSSLDVILARSFGDRFAQVDPPDPAAVFGERDLALELDARPHLLALSCHQLRQPLVKIGRTRLVPYLLLRHPLDRLHSVWSFERTPDRQAQSTGPITRWAAELDFPGFITQCLRFQNSVGLVSNFQTRVCGTVLAKDMAEDWSRPVGPGHLLDAMAFLETMPAVGVVEEFDASMAQLSAATRSLFPQFMPLAVQANRSRKAVPLAERLDALRAELGAPLWARLVEANAMDLTLHRLAMERLARGR